MEKCIVLQESSAQSVKIQVVCAHIIRIMRLTDSKLLNTVNYHYSNFLLYFSQFPSLSERFLQQHFYILFMNR